MTDDEKAPYKEKAKSGEVKIPKRNCASSASNQPVNRSGLYTSQGVPVSLYEEEAKAKLMETENMRRRIGNMIQQVPLMTGA